MSLDTIEDAIEEIRNGKMIIVVDDEERENEGDIICAAECVTPEIINFMRKHAGGLICVPLTEERCDELDLTLMVHNNTATHSTPFTVSVDLLGHGCTTGISAADRAKTILALVNTTTKPTDLGRPGHIFPLRAKAGGVLRRTGHTEAAIDFARLAGMNPAGVLIEVMHDDGTMARLPELRAMADQFNLKLVSIKDLVSYRLRRDKLVKREVAVKMPTKWGNFDMITYSDIITDDLHFAMVKGDLVNTSPTLVRVHSACITGDIFSSCLCECSSRLHAAMEMIEKEGCGLVLYMNQRGKQSTLADHMEHIRHGVAPDQKLSSYGSTAMDDRDFGIGAQILRDLGVVKMKLITNNLKKRVGLSAYGLEVIENVTIDSPLC